MKTPEKRLRRVKNEVPTRASTLVNRISEISVAITTHGDREAYDQYESLIMTESTERAFVTLEEIRRLWRVQTLATAEEFESPATKLRRFFSYVQLEIDYIISPSADEERKADPFYKRFASMGGVRPTDKESDQHAAYYGSPSEFLNGFLQVQPGEPRYIPRAWLDDLERAWKVWKKADNARKASRPTAERKRTPEGKFEPKSVKGKAKEFGKKLR